MSNVDLPILIGCPDSPVSKRKPTDRLADVAPNGGIHYHFILAVPPITRLKVPLHLHVKDEPHIYLGTHGTISKFDLRPFPRDKAPADYLLKHIKRRTYTTDDILILPGGTGEKVWQARAVSSHPMPHELRADFRRLLASCRSDLLAGNVVEVRNPGNAVGPALLSMLPHTDAGVSANSRRNTTERSNLCPGTQAFTLSSATLVIPAAGERTTAVRRPDVVLRDLEAIFHELVVRDAQFQATPKFAAIANSLAPLAHGKCLVKVIP